MAPSTDARGRSATGATLGLAVGTRCFVPDKRRMWLPVTVEYVDPQRQLVTFTIDGDQEEDDDAEPSRMQVSLADQPHFPLQNARAATRGGYEDMIELNHLHEAAILFNLKRRFKARLPYTFTGDICLALNPYQWLEELYTSDLHTKYLGATSRKQLPPHVYAVSVAAYKHMGAQRENQSILVSGESGAGKTETTKILMDNLAQIANTSSSKQQQSTIQRILDVNPLLESFGNAKTKRNDNSSRFGKFTQLQFQQSRSKMVLCGAKCETYLLEKTRVVTQEKGERNYHIFYQIYHGSTQEEKVQWGLDGGGKFTQFNYVDDDDDRMTHRDAGNFEKTKRALTLLGLESDRQQALFRTLAGVLHLGQSVFEADKHNEDASRADRSSLIVAGELLGLALAPMEKALCTRTMKAGGEVYAVPLTVAQANSSRDALAKAIYANIFTWMVEQINRSLSANDSDVDHTIGVLDIFGFESFVHNSFEQLCINYANEKLQQKFTQDVFKGVQEEYEAENITWDHISYADNSDILALIEGKLGIIALLNEEIVRPKGSDEGFVSKLQTSFRQQKKIIEFPRISRTQFSVHHYADTVKYEAVGFLEKHKDALLPDLSELMRGSSEPFVQKLFEEKKSDAPDAPDPRASSGRARRFGGPGGAGGSADSQTVGTQFKQSLNRLMDNINKTNVHYIRCIKPNSEKSTTKVDEQMVVNQLRCAGVIEAIHLARAGYPNRMKHEEFVREFDIFLTGAQRKRVGDERKLCVVLAKDFELKTPEEYQMGKTKIYLQLGVLDRLEALKAEKLFSCVALIQSRWRGIVARRLFVKLYSAALIIQQRAHVFVASMRFRRAQFAVRLMQRVWRGHMGRCVFHERLCQHRALQIQRVWRGHAGRLLYRKALCNDRAIRIQCAWRCRSSRKKLWRLQDAFQREQARLRAIEQERLRQLELQRQREEEERERQRRLAEEAEALRRKREQEERERREREEREQREREERERREREEQERREREERERREREEQERREREERERQERLRLERERLERERREREELERRLREEEEARRRAEAEARRRQEAAAVTMQRIARGTLARQKFAQLKLDEEVFQRRAAKEAEELNEAREENERLKQQLEELLEANIELETLVAEWKCEQDVLLAATNVQETDLKRQLTQQKQKLETARGEYATLCAYLDQNGGELPPPDDGDHPESDDTDNEDSHSDSDNESSFTSPFMDDRTSTNVSSYLQRPSRTTLTARFQATAKQIGKAKQWSSKKSTTSSSGSQMGDVPQTRGRQASIASAITGVTSRMPKLRWK